MRHINCIHSLRYYFVDFRLLIPMQTELNRIEQAVASLCEEARRAAEGESTGSPNDEKRH